MTAVLVIDVEDKDTGTPYKAHIIFTSGDDAFAATRQLPDPAEEKNVRAMMEEYKGKIGMVRYFDGSGARMTNGPNGAPASISFYEDGTLQQVAYAGNNQLNDTPTAFALTNYAADGTKTGVYSYKEGVFLRTVPMDEEKSPPSAPMRSKPRHFRI